MTPEERAQALLDLLGWTLKDIQDMIGAAIAEEREACARAVEEHACQHGTTCVGSLDIPKYIRARP